MATSQAKHGLPRLRYGLTMLDISLRVDWIVQWLLENEVPGADVLNADLVNDYINEFNPQGRLCNWGAHKVPELGYILSQGYKANRLDRGTISLINHEPDFPNWVYAYTIKNLKGG